MYIYMPIFYAYYDIATKAYFIKYVSLHPSIIKPHSNICCYDTQLLSSTQMQTMVATWEAYRRPKYGRRYFIHNFYFDTNSSLYFQDLITTLYIHLSSR